MRYRAWLDAWPGPKAKRSRLATLQTREDEGQDVPELELPEVDEALAHIVDYLFEVGPVIGEHAVPFTEIESWTRLTGVVIDEYETTAIRALSQEYLGMLHEARDANCPAPVMHRATLPSKAEVSSALGALLRSFATPKAKADLAKRQAARAAAKANEPGKVDE